MCSRDVIGIIELICMVLCRAFPRVVWGHEMMEELKILSMVKQCARHPQSDPPIAVVSYIKPCSTSPNHNTGPVVVKALPEFEPPSMGYLIPSMGPLHLGFSMKN